jgi:hypothetical protein
MTLRTSRGISSIRLPYIVCRRLAPVGQVARQLTTSIDRPHAPASALVLLFATLLGLLLCSRPVLAQVGPNESFFEIDGDYGSSIGYYTGSDWIMDVRDGEPPTSTLGRQATESCEDWWQVASGTVEASTPTVHPYMGMNMYSVRCNLPEFPSDEARRTEQMILADWTAGTDSTRYFTLAFMLARALPLDHRTFITQWHQDGGHPPPLRLHWQNDNGTNILQFGVRYDYIDSNHQMREDGWQPVGDDIPVSVGVWYRFLVQVTPGPSGQVAVWQMDNQTGTWDSVGSYTGQVGFLYQSCDEQSIPQCTGDARPFEPGYGFPEAVRLTGKALEYQWKVGIYVNETDNILLYYDNIAYGKRWNNVTKNRLTGYHKTVLALGFDEGQGATVNDQSYWWNGGQPGDPVADYNNDGRIQGTPWWNPDGVSGRSLHFDGSTYVTVPMDMVDFDVGNYVTVAAWFRTTNHPTDNKGLIFIDEYASTWKVKLYMSDTSLSFGVKHPDDTYATVNYPFAAGTYADGEWHHVVGTFNRFSPDGRLKLYIDGDRKLVTAGYDKPIKRGESQVAVGKFSTNGWFVGDMDDVLVRNSAMTDAEVAELYDVYAP